MRPVISLLLGLVLSAMPVAGDESFAPALYPFQNGVDSMPAGEAARMVKELGYPGIGSVYPQRLAEFKAACDAAGLRIFSIYVGVRVGADGFRHGPEVAEAIALLKGTGALVELNLQRGRDPTDAMAVALVNEVADMAKDAGLNVVLYPHADFHVERVDHALEIATATGRDNVGVAFNLCHFLKVQPGDDLAALLAAAKPLLWSVSLCGADADGKDWRTLIRPLDEGSFDQAGLLRMLRGIGYDGAAGLQCYAIKTAPGEHLARSMAAWREHLAASRRD